MKNVYRVNFLDNKNLQRIFVTEGSDIADATNTICDLLENPDGLFCGAKGWMHVETTLIVKAI